MNDAVELRDYFEGSNGIGVLATADSEGKVNAALYARPHVMEDGKVAFIMSEGLSYNNVCSNEKATYLFVEKGEAYNGKRLYLKKVGEESDENKINAVRRRPEKYKGASKVKHIIYFQIDKVRALIGD